MQTISKLHDKGIIIRDLDVSHIYLTQNSDLGILRISDLQNALIMGPKQKTNKIIGDINFRAPEVLQGKPYNFKADLFSVGVIIFYMCTQQMPFKATADMSLEDHIIG